MGYVPKCKWCGADWWASFDEFGIPEQPIECPSCKGKRHANEIFEKYKHELWDWASGV